jgi:RimJ/RimL family protein N-acetyltransferase
LLLKDGRELTIRKAVKEDAPAILEYLNLVGGESDNLLVGAGGFEMTVEEEEQYIENMNSSVASALLVGFIDGRIACDGGFTAHTKERIAHQAEMGMSVRKEFWGIGVGLCLINEMIRFARETEKLEMLQLETKEDNEPAKGLYRKVGFQEIGRRPKFFKIDGKYYDSIIMNLNL